MGQTSTGRQNHLHFVRRTLSQSPSLRQALPNCLSVGHRIRRTLRTGIQISRLSQRTSLAQYLAAQLSGRIKRGRITRVEGAFISKEFESSIRFRTRRGKVVRSSLTNMYDLSMFRLVGIEA